MREITVEHVERKDAPVWSTFYPEHEFRFRIDGFANEPGRTDAIDLWPRSSQPHSAAKVWWLELRLHFRRRLSSFQLPQNYLDIFRFGAVEKICRSDLVKLSSNAIEFVTQIGGSPGIDHERTKHLAKRGVFLRPRCVEQLL